MNNFINHKVNHIVDNRVNHTVKKVVVTPPRDLLGSIGPQRDAPWALQKGDFLFMYEKGLKILKLDLFLKEKGTKVSQKQNTKTKEKGQMGYERQ